MIDQHVETEVLEKHSFSDYMDIDIFSNEYYFSELKHFVPKWYSKRRDLSLRSLANEVDLIKLAIQKAVEKLSSLELLVTPVDPSINAFTRRAKLTQSFIENHIIPLYDQILGDIYTTDTGGYIVLVDVDEDGNLIQFDQPRTRTKLPEMAIHLDSTFVNRTGDLWWPITYDPKSGERIAVHFTRLIDVVDSISPSRNHNGIGLCAVSKLLNNIEYIQGIDNQTLEMLGSLPTSQIVHLRGGTADQAKEAFELASKNSINEGRKNSSSNVYMGGPVQSQVEVHKLTTLPTGFDRNKDIQQAVNIISNAFLLEPRDFLVGFASGSRSESEFSHNKSNMLLQSWWNRKFLLKLRNTLLPNGVNISITENDPLIDKTRKESYSLFSTSLRQQIESGILDLKTARQLQLEEGLLTEAQYESLELNDGRTIHGLPVESLFYSSDPVLMRYLNFVDDPLSEDNDPDEMLVLIEQRLAQARADFVDAKSNDESLRVSRQVIAALTWLQGLMLERANPELEDEEEALGAEEQVIETNL